MTPSPSFSTCPKCHAALPPSAPRGLCPACLMDAAGMETEVMPAADAFGAPLDLDTLRRAFPQFEILAPLGAGGMGRVYKVRQPNLDRVAALKVLPPELAHDAGWVERFTREARALARLNHPNIVQVFDVGQAAGGAGGSPLCWLLMEYVDGVTLRQVQRTGGLSAREALSLIPKLCDALQYAHEKGVLHRDIKPENILLDSAGTAKIADFGLAKLGGAHPAPTLTVVGARLGTAAYMAPEQIESPADVDHRADIYSLGVVLYELLTGGLPLGRFPAPSEKSGTDPRLDHIVFRTLEKERERRYQAAGEVRTALETVAAGPQPPPLPAPPLPHPQQQPAHGAPIPPQPRVMHAKHPHPAEAPPNGPPEPVMKVTYQQVKPGRPTLESANPGCRRAFLALLLLALAAAPGFIPVLWYEGIQQWNRSWLTKIYPESMPFVAAGTAFLAWLAARPLWRMMGLADVPWVKRKAPLFLVIGLGMIATVMVMVSNASRSYPNRGVVRTLHFSCLRPPLAANDANPLEAVWQQRVEEEFGPGDNKAVFQPELRDEFNDYPDGRPSPLHKLWHLSVAGTTLSATDARLARLAGNLIAGLPENLRSSVSMSIDGRTGYPQPGTMSLRREETFALIGIAMTLGGWLLALTRRRPVYDVLAPCLLALIVAGAWYTPAVRRLSEVIIPLPDPEEGVSPPQPAWIGLAEKANSGQDQEIMAVFRWIDACRRLDREAAEAHVNGKFSDAEWQRVASYWNANSLLSVTRDPSTEAKGEKGTDFVCLVIPHPVDDPSAGGGYYYSGGYYSYYGEQARRATAAKLRVTAGEGGTWHVQQTN